MKPCRYIDDESYGKNAVEWNVEIEQLRVKNGDERKKTVLEMYSERFDILIRAFGKRQVSAEEFARAHQALRYSLFG